MLRGRRSIARLVLATALVSGGLGAAGGAWLARSQISSPMTHEAAQVDLMPSNVDSPEMSPPLAPSGPAAKPRRLPAKPAQPPAAPIMSSGVVTTIAPEPASFAFRTESGDEVVVRVLESTVFAAGPDRPYNFDLLKVGDGVRVRVTPAGPADTPRPGSPPRAPQQPAHTAPTAGEPVARQVLVRPAGERPFTQPGKPAAKKKGEPTDGVPQ